MSHVVTMQSQVRDREVARAACARLGLPDPVEGLHRLYAGQQASGLGVKLPGWQYPAVFDLETGSAAFDNFEGHWGDIQRLHDFTNAYGVEACRKEAMLHGHGFSESVLSDGTIEVTIEQYA